MNEREEMLPVELFGHAVCNEIEECACDVKGVIIKVICQKEHKLFGKELVALNVFEDKLPAVPQ
jgi:hypothetical protein